MAEDDTPAWGVLRALPAYQAAYEVQAQPPAFEDGTAFPVRIQSEAELAARDPWRIEVWENPCARDGPASPFLDGEAMLEAEGSATALLPFLAEVGAHVDRLRLIDRGLIVKIERDHRAVQVQVTEDGPLLAGRGYRTVHDLGPDMPRKIARLTALWGGTGRAERL